LITLKQLEALHWIAELGTFERAAAKLNTTQSAISKRIQELETATSIAVFDRTQRGARLTEEGASLLAIGQEMLGLRERIFSLKGAQESPARRLRMGVTELTALTWLPALVSELRTGYPRIRFEPEVDLSRNLFERLLNGSMDLIVIPEAFGDRRVSALRLAEVQNSWMASPDLVPGDRTLTLEELGAYTILSQGAQSGSGVYLDRWLRSRGASFSRVLSSNSLVALVGLTLAGIGVSYLPRRCYQPLVETGKLRVISTRPLLPPVPYAAMYCNDQHAAFNARIAALAQAVCDFSTQNQR
jgi:DNA-binding transcriptional LysR family regulator